MPAKQDESYDSVSLLTQNQLSAEEFQEYSEKTWRIKKAFARPDIIKAESCRRSLFYFIRTFWDIVSVDTPVWNWHIPYLCGHLMRAAYRVGNHLPNEHDIIINIPPGTTKSITCSVMFPVWCWTNWHWMRFITSSYSAALSLELAEYSREIVRSARFKRLFPDLVIKRDKDTKSNFRLQKLDFDERGETKLVRLGGNRYSTSVGGTVTGFHGHILITDDPLDPNRAASDQEISNANRFMDQTLPTRKADKETAVSILIQQRLGQFDPSGHLLGKSKEKKLLHISLPGEIRNFKEQLHPKELKSYYKDDLLDPNRMPWKVLKGMEIDLGQYGYSSQVGQFPVPPAGGMFKPDNMPIVQRNTSAIVRRPVRYWDKAGSLKGAYTVGVKMARLENGRYCIFDVQRQQLQTHERERLIQRTAEMDGSETIIYMEQEPGSSGIDSVKSSISGLDGYSAHADRPTGDKVHRADPFSVQVNMGNVEMIEGAWNQAFIEELRYFPMSKYKDQVDAASGAYMKLKKPKVGVW